MNHLDLTALLRINPYPGRGIVMGSSPDGSCSVIAYFIMGRSENSRNRIIGLGADAVGGLHKHTVAGVLAAAHDEVGNDRLGVVGGAAQHDAAAGIGIALQQLGQVQRFHNIIPLL